MLKRLLSYFTPITILKQKSNFSKTLEVTWINGKLVLDSKNTNYSYGNLQRVLRKGLKVIGFERIVEMESILVLGVAGGSVIRTLVDEIDFKGSITGVEIDKSIIDIANTYFRLDNIPNVEIIIDDAFEFVLKAKNKYNLIIIDIFQDSTMPGFLFELHFIARVCNLLNPNGLILFNTMVLNDAQKKMNLDFKNSFDSTKYLAKSIRGIDSTNELLLIKSKH